MVEVRAGRKGADEDHEENAQERSFEEKGESKRGGIKKKINNV